MKNIEHRTILLGGDWVEYDLVRSFKRKTICVTVAVERKMRVLAPEKIEICELEKFICQKEAWILDKLSETREISSKVPKFEYTDGEKFKYLDSTIELKVKKIGKNSKAFCNLRDGKLIVRIGKSTPSGRVSALVEEIVYSWYRKQAEKYLIERTRWHSWNSGIRYSSVSLSNARRQWGSCDQYGNLRFNWRIIMACPKLIDYVIIHELCHIRHRNHSGNYWSLVETFVPDYKTRRNALKKSPVAFMM